MSDDPATSAVICGIGMITAIGGNALQTLASFRAGISRYAEGPVHNRNFEPMTMALVPEDVLPPITEEIADRSDLTGRQIRMLRLATPALLEVTAPLEKQDPLPLFLAVPESLKDRAPAVPDHFPSLLAAQTGMEFDLAASRLFRTGRVAGLQALGEAMKFLQTGSHEFVLVGGVDTYLDLYLLEMLDQDDRILANDIMDGFAPGEGAGFLLIGMQDRVSMAPLAALRPPGFADEPGYRYSRAAYQGDGLASAIRDALEDGEDGPVQWVLGSINGESFGAKEWGVAVMRNQQQLASGLRFDHPADSFGDTGASVAPILIGLAAMDLHMRTVTGPALVWCASDGRQRGAVRIASC